MDFVHIFTFEFGLENDTYDFLSFFLSFFLSLVNLLVSLLVSELLCKQKIITRQTFFQVYAIVILKLVCSFASKKEIVFFQPSYLSSATGSLSSHMRPKDYTIGLTGGGARGTPAPPPPQLPA